MHSKILSVMLMALVFIVACAAAPASSNSARPVPDVVLYGNSTLRSERMSSRAMGCTTKGYIKICQEQSDEVADQRHFEYVNDHFLYELPNWKKTNNYLFCFDEFKCAAMTTLSGSQFIPANYKHVAEMAVRDMQKLVICKANDSQSYRRAIDIYYYEYNFVFSWFFNRKAWGTCSRFPGTVN